MKKLDGEDQADGIDLNKTAILPLSQLRAGRPGIVGHRRSQSGILSAQQAQHLKKPKRDLQKKLQQLIVLKPKDSTRGDKENLVENVGHRPSRSEISAANRSVLDETRSPTKSSAMDPDKSAV